MTSFLITKTREVPDAVICWEDYADSCLGQTRRTLGALHASGEHHHTCLTFRSLEELSSTCIQMKATWNLASVLLQHDNTWPQARAAVTAIQDLHFECLPHPPYSPDVAPSDYHMFGPLKVAMGGKKLHSDEEV
jgi:hypothetical protein